MRYLLFFLLAISLQASAQSNSAKPYHDIIIGGMLVYPMAANPDEHYAISSAVACYAGFDLMINPRYNHVFLSIGPRIGFGGFKAISSDGRVYDSRSANSGFTVGLNYSSNPAGPSGIIVAALMQGGLKLRLYQGPLVAPYYMPEAKIGVRINRTLGFMLYGSYEAITAYRGSPKHIKDASEDFNTFTAGAELRISIGAGR